MTWRRNERSASQRRWPRAMSEPPPLPLAPRGRSPEPRTALLLLPFYPKDPNGSFGKHVLTPASTMTSLAAATPSSWQVRFFDENLLSGAPPCSPVPQVVGITVHLTFAQRAYELARWYRSMGSLVVMGGLHVAACPEEVAAEADAIVLGEGVGLWAQILADVERGALEPRYQDDGHGELGDELLPRRDILDRSSYLTTASLIATRGCRNHCDFCYLSTAGVRSPRTERPVEQVAEDFRRTGEPYGVFVDNNLGARPEYLRSLCRALRPLGKIWSAAVTVDIADDESLVAEMAAAGCTGVFVGLETLSARNLVDARKRTARPGSYGRQVEVFHRHGVQVNGSFVFGFDHDGPEVFEHTVDWIERHRLECATFHILTPYPRGRRCFSASRPRGESSTATGRATTRRTWSSGQRG